MLALTAAAQGPNPILVVVIIATVVVFAFWQQILKLTLVALAIGFMFLLVSGALGVLHVLHALIP